MTMATEPAPKRFKAGDIIRYAEGVSALFRYGGTHNCDRLYGDHVLGGSYGAADQMFYDLRLASERDLAYCREHRPEWFAPDAHLVELVNRFSEALLQKLRDAEKKHDWNNYWMRDDWESVAQQCLQEHVRKGDPLDVAAFAAFCWHHGYRTSPQQ